MPFIRLSDGTVAHVRLGKRGARLTQRDMDALEALALAVNQAERDCPHCLAGDPFFDDARIDHFIQTEAGIATERCRAKR
jgi:hypothetical protein